MKFEIDMRMSKLKDFESLVGVISRNPSENRSVKSFPPPKKKKHQQINQGFLNKKPSIWGPSTAH